MREPDHFNYFRDIVLPYLAKTIKDKDLKIWCAACSTGEESYTLSMLIDEFLGKQKSLWNSKILATDISKRVLDIAKKGEYSSENIAKLPNHWKLNYFDKVDAENYSIKDKIKNETIYRQLNLMETVFPFKKKFNVIFCRNVMIYFDAQTKDKLIEKFYHNLEDGGYLFIGHSETLNREKVSFENVSSSIFRKV